jgi:DNA-binding response OmpR family regulator
VAGLNGEQRHRKFMTMDILASPVDGPERGLREFLTPPKTVPARAPVRHVAVVEDDRVMASGLALVLQLWGFEVTTVYDGARALPAIRAARPDAVLLDLGLPGLSGLDVARQIRSDAELGGILLIALTGFGDEPSRQASADAGFDRYLMKPVEPERLRALLGAPGPRVA